MATPCNHSTPIPISQRCKRKNSRILQKWLSLREIEKRSGGSKTKILQTLHETGVEVRSFQKGNPQQHDLTKVMRSGATPYGYCYLDGKLVVDNREQQVIHRIIEMKTNGMSFRAIARSLNDKKIRTRLGKCWRHFVVKQIYMRTRPKT